MTDIDERIENGIKIKAARERGGIKGDCFFFVFRKLGGR